MQYVLGTESVEESGSEEWQSADLAGTPFIASNEIPEESILGYCLLLAVKIETS